MKQYDSLKHDPQLPWLDFAAACFFEPNLLRAGNYLTEYLTESGDMSIVNCHGPETNHARVLVIRSAVGRDADLELEF